MKAEEPRDENPTEEGNEDEYEETLDEHPACGVFVREAFPSNYQRLIHAPSSLVMFYSQGCAHCHATMPHLRQASMFLCGGPKISMACVDLDGIAEYAQNVLKITALPTMIIFKNGVEIARVEGAQTTKEIVEWARQHQG
jgi:thioredoxin-like negative regulator of GroEL